MALQLHKLYRVRADQHITVRIVPGQGQPAATTLRLKGQEVLVGHDDEVMPDGQAFDLGMGSDLDNATLICVTSVQDVNPVTNLASVHYFLDGGPAPWDQELNEDLGEHGSADFVAVIDFVLANPGSPNA